MFWWVITPILKHSECVISEYTCMCIFSQFSDARLSHILRIDWKYTYILRLHILNAENSEFWKLTENTQACSDALRLHIFAQITHQGTVSWLPLSDLKGLKMTAMGLLEYGYHLRRPAPADDYDYDGQIDWESTKSTKSKSLLRVHTGHKWGR